MTYAAHAHGKNNNPNAQKHRRTYNRQRPERTTGRHLSGLTDRRTDKQTERQTNAERNAITTRARNQTNRNTRNHITYDTRRIWVYLETMRNTDKRTHARSTRTKTNKNPRGATRRKRMAWHDATGRDVDTPRNPMTRHRATRRDVDRHDAARR